MKRTSTLCFAATSPELRFVLFDWSSIQFEGILKESIVIQPQDLPSFENLKMSRLQIQISDTDPYSSARLGGFLCILQLRAEAAETLSLLRARLYFRQKYTTRTLQHIFQPDILLWDHIGHSMLGNLVLRTDLDFLWTGLSQFPKTASETSFLRSFLSRRSPIAPF